jgi:HEAT repeat protein
LRAAQGLLAGKDATGVPVLVELLAETPLDVAFQAEELLCWLAGYAAPRELVGNGGQQAVKCRRAWRAWLRDNPGKANPVAALHSHRRPRLLIVCQKQLSRTRDAITNTVDLIGADGRVRWTPFTSTDVLDLQWLPRGRLLLTGWRAPLLGTFVSEFDLKEDMQWSVEVSQIGTCRTVIRQADGTTVAIGSDATLLLQPNGECVRYWEQVPEDVCETMPTLRGGRVLRGDDFRIVEEDRERRVFWETFISSLKIQRVRVALGLVSFGFPQSQIDIEHDLGYQASALESALPKMRYLALSRLAAKRDWALSALPQVVEALNDSDAEVRDEAVQCVATLGPRAARAVPRLMEMLESVEKPTPVDDNLIRALRNLGPVALPALLKTAEASKNPRARVLALLVLEKLSDETERARPALFAALNDNEKTVRYAGVYYVGTRAPCDPACMKALLGAVDDPEEIVRASAIVFLCKCEPVPTKAAFPLFRELLPDIRRPHADIIDTLGRLGQRDPTICKKLLAKVQEGQLDALDGFGVMGANGTSAIGELTRWAEPPQDDNGHLKGSTVSALFSLADLAEHDSAAGEVIVKFFRKIAAKMPDLAFHLLFKVDRAERGRGQAIKLILELIEKDDPLWQHREIIGWMELGKDSPAALVDLIQRSEGKVRERTQQALCQVAQPGPDAVPSLLEILAEGDTTLQIAAINALKRIGPRAGSAAPQLHAALRDDNLAYYAAIALASIEPDRSETAAALLQVLRNWENPLDIPDFDYHRNRVITALGRLGSRGKPAVPFLITLLESQPASRGHAAWPNDWIERLIEAENKPAADRLRFAEALTSGNQLTRHTLISALANLAPVSDKAFATILRTASNPSASSLERWLASEALTRLGPKHHAHLKDLLPLLRDERTPVHVQYDAIKGVGAMGPAARDAVPLLKQLAAEGTFPIRKAARAALAKINP